MARKQKLISLLMCLCYNSMMLRHDDKQLHENIYHVKYLKETYQAELAVNGL